MLEKRGIYHIPVELTHFSIGSRRPLLGAIGMTAIAILVGLNLGSAWGLLAEKVVDHLALENSKQITRVLNDPSNLRPDQKFYDKVRIVGAGYNLEMKAHMDATKSPIGVTRGIGGRVVAKVRVGNIAHDVIIQDEVAATRCGNIEGLEPIKDGGTLPGSDEICAFNWVFSQKIN